MKISALAIAIAAVTASSAWAADPPRAVPQSQLLRTVAYLESRYPGDVVAIVLDDSGDKRAHYHVDMRFAGGGMATLDVDAASHAISARDYAGAFDARLALHEAVAVIAAHIPGDVVDARLDASDGAPAHYDVDVRLPRGDIARLKVDTRTRDLGWRMPPVLAD